MIKKKLQKTKEKIIKVVHWFKRTELISKICRWLWYGVFLSLLPCLILYIFNRIVGYNMKVVETLPDYLLLTFAIAVNALANETDKEKCLNPKIRKVFKFFSRATLFSSIVFYIGLFNEGFIAPNITALLMKNESSVLILYKCVTVALIVNIILGILIEISNAILMDKKRAAQE